MLRHTHMHTLRNLPIQCERNTRIGPLALNPSNLADQGLDKKQSSNPAKTSQQLSLASDGIGHSSTLECAEL